MFISLFCLIGEQLPQKFHGKVAVVLVDFDWTVQATHVIQQKKVVVGNLRRL